MKINVNGAEKEVEISKIYTRKIDREYNNILFEWQKVTPQQLSSGSFEVDLEKFQKANDYLILQMTNLTQDELDEMDSADYNKLLEEINNIKIPSKE